MHGLSHIVPPKLPTAPMLNHVQVVAPHNKQPGGPARGYPNHGGPRAGLDGTHGNSLTFRHTGRKGSDTTKQKQQTRNTPSLGLCPPRSPTSLATPCALPSTLRLTPKCPQQLLAVLQVARGLPRVLMRPKTFPPDQELFLAPDHPPIQQSLNLKLGLLVVL